MFWVFFHPSLSFLVSNSAISSFDSRELLFRHFIEFPRTITAKLPRCRLALHQRLYIASTFQIWSKLAGYEELTRRKPIRSGEICQVNNNIQNHQISGERFSRVLIGSRNSEYPWIFTVLGRDSTCLHVSRQFRKMKF